MLSLAIILCLERKINNKHETDHETALPTKTFQLDEVFQPSATMTETDWFILDENGRRRRKMSKDEIEEVGGKEHPN